MSVNATSQFLNMIEVKRGNDVKSAASNDQPPELYPDIMTAIFNTCISMCDVRTITAFHCTNKYWNQIAIGYFAGCDLKQICPELTIMDAKTQKRDCADEPKIDKFKIFKAVKRVAPHVEDNAGVTLLTLIKGDTLNKLIEIAAQEGMQVLVPWNAIIEELGDVPVEETSIILITNSVFMGTREENYNSQNTLVEGHGCQMPMGREHVALCVFAKKIFQKCLYGKNGQNLPTYGRSSTHVQGIPLVVGGFDHRGRLSVNDNVSFDSIDDETFGAGGQLKF